MTENTYRIINSTNPADIREGDRVTFTRPESDWPKDEHRGFARIGSDAEYPWLGHRGDRFSDEKIQDLLETGNYAVI